MTTFHVLLKMKQILFSLGKEVLLSIYGYEFQGFLHFFSAVHRRALFFILNAPRVFLSTYFCKFLHDVS